MAVQTFGQPPELAAKSKRVQPFELVKLKSATIKLTPTTCLVPSMAALVHRQARAHRWPEACACDVVDVHSAQLPSPPLSQAWRDLSRKGKSRAGGADGCVGAEDHLPSTPTVNCSCCHMSPILRQYCTAHIPAISNDRSRHMTAWSCDCGVCNTWPILRDR